MMFTEPIHQPYPIPFHGNRIGNQVANAISNAFRDKGFDRRYAKAFGAWYFAKAPDNSVIQDETPNRKDRPELATTGSVFDCTNYFETLTADEVICGEDNTPFTVRVLFSGSGTSANGDYLCSTYDSSPSEGWRIWLNSGFIGFALQDIAGVNRSVLSTLTTADVQAGGIYEVVGVYDPIAAAVLIYVNGEYHEENAAPSFDAAVAGRFRIATKAEATTGKWFGNIYEVQIWNDQALTAAEIVKLYDKEISYFQGDKAPSVAWLLDGPTCTELIGDNDLTPVADPSAYSGSLGSTWLNDQGWNTTVYRSDFSEGFDNWTVSTPSTKEIVDFAGKSNVLKFTAGDDGDGTASSDRLQNSLSWDDLVDGENYTLKFDLYIPSSNGELDRVRLASSVLGGETVIPNLDIWETIELTGEAFTSANTYLRIYANNGSYVVDTGDVFYITNIEVIAEERVYPKRWGADLDVNGNVADDAKSFGPCKRNREYRNGPAITLDGTMRARTTYDASGRTTLSGFARILQTDNTNDQNIFDQSNGTVGWGFRLENIDATTAALAFFHYPDEGGSADVISSVTAIVTLNEVHDIGFSWSAATGDALFFVDDLEVFGGAPASTGILSDTTLMAIGNTNGIDNRGVRGKLWDLRLFEGELTQAEFNWIRTQGVSGTEPSNMVRHWPVIEEAGVKIQDVVAGDVATFTNDPTWDFTANDSFFHGEEVGYSAVPIFVEPVELVSSTNVNFDGVMECIIEIDFYYSVSGTQDFFCVSSAAPIRIRTSGSTIQVFVRDSVNGATSTNLLVLTAGELYRLKIVITEHATDPENLSSIVITDRLTGELLASATDCDIAMSQAGANIGNPQIGIYANATNPFLGDMYRVRMWADDTLQVSVDFPSFANAGAVSDFTESGGTLDIKKIPAVSKSLDANGYPTTNPAGPYHNRTAAEVTETPISNSDSVNPICYGCEGDGVGYLAIDGQVTLNGAFDIEFDIYASSFDVTGVAIGKNGGHKIGFNSSGSGIWHISIDGSTDLTVAAPSDGAWHECKISRDSEDVVTLTVDGTEYLLYSGAPISGDLDITNLFSRSGLDVLACQMKNVKITDAGVVVLDMPLYKDSLDRSPSAKHASIAVAGITFLSNAMETDLNPDIAESETRAVTTGDSKIISIGARQ